MESAEKEAMVLRAVRTGLTDAEAAIRLYREAAKHFRGNAQVELLEAAEGLEWMLKKQKEKEKS